MKQIKFIVVGISLLMAFVTSSAMGQRISLVSVNNSGVGGNGESRNHWSQDSVISADGRFIVFTSFTNNLAPNDVNNNGDIFVRDVVTGTTTLVSINRFGTGSGNSLSDYPAISANGRYVAYSSHASDLVPNDTNGLTPDIFVRDLVAGTTTLVSVNRFGTGSGNNWSMSIPSLSADGRYITFNSGAGNLVANDTNGSTYFDTFVRDMVTGTTTLVTVNSAGTGSGNNSIVESSLISDDGRYVFFLSEATNLVAQDDNNNAQDVFVRDLQTGVTSLISINSAGTGAGNAISGGESNAPVISPNGRFVAFDSDASDLVTNDFNGSFSDVFVRDLVTGTTTLVTVNHAGTGSGNNKSYLSSMSPDASHVGFASNASDLVTNDTQQTTDAFVRDLVTGTTTLVSVNTAGTGSGDGQSFDVEITADARFVVFNSSATNLVVSNSPHNLNLFLRNMMTGTTTLITSNMTGTGGGNHNSHQPVISRDGRIITFLSQASNLAPNNNNGSLMDIFATRLPRNVGDYDGDRRTDLAVWRPDDGNWYTLNLFNGSTRTQQWGHGALSDKAVPADYDGDGKTDLAVWRESNGTWYIMQSSDNSFRANQWGAIGDKPAPADFDGDGRADLAVYRPSNGTWYILQSSNNALRADQWGVSEDKPVPADFDGDGRADLAVYRPSQGTWYIYQSTNNSFRGQQWGISTDHPVAGDYDLDGKIDVAVWRPSDGYWYALKSSDGAMHALQWGSDGDVPQPADYDGDGRTDAAVWRATTGVWYILKSSNGAVIEQVLGNNVDVPVSSNVIPY